MDNISATAIAARRAGMSYGQYVALHGIRYSDKPILADVPTKVCPECGKEFPAKGRRANAVNCDAECQRKYNIKKESKRYYERKKGINND